MKSCISDATKFLKRIGDKLSGLCVTYVDDTRHAKDLKYSELTKLTEDKLRYQPRGWRIIQLAGVPIKKTISDSTFTRRATLRN